MLLFFFMGLAGFNLLYVWILSLRVRAERLEYSQSHEQL